MRVLFSRNCAYVKFGENKNLAKNSEFTVPHNRFSQYEAHILMDHLSAVQCSELKLV